ncbi:MAG: hypothetical protein AB8B69_07695 [Chitinophagales bacterium]
MFTFNKVSISKLFEEDLYDLKDELLKPQEEIVDKKKIVVVVNYENHAFPKSELDFLEKILKAAKVNMNEVAMIYAKSQPHSFKVLQEHIPCNKLIVFGIKAPELELNIRLGLYQLITFRNCQLLFADDLTSISKDVKRKTYLWRNLQKMFEL